MAGSDDKGIQSKPMVDIDIGFHEPEESPRSSLNSEAPIENEAVERAAAFSEWLAEVLDKLEDHVCFVDYTVFLDAKTKNPYFYLVSPTVETKMRYVSAVKELVEGTYGEQDCFSVAFHPDFVGIGNYDNYTQCNSFTIVPVRLTDDQSAISNSPGVAKGVEDWNADFYPLWPKNETRWPPTSKSELRRICGRHTLAECFAKFQSILAEARNELCDSSGRPLTYLFCVPLLISDPSSERSISNLPFSEIAAALFLGISHEGNAEEVTAAVTPFVRALALRTYRAGMKRAGEAGQVAGIEQAIETFAHQIKGVANAMSTKWSVNLGTWEEIQDAFRDDTFAAPYLEAARVLPAPQLIEAVRETLILWSQTRRIDDLYDPRPACFRDVVDRAWEFTSRIRFALGNISRNLGESLGDLIKVWGQDWTVNAEPKASGQIEMVAKPEITGAVDGNWGDWKEIDLDVEGRLCSVTRLLVAIFDNLAEHGMPGQAPRVQVAVNDETRTVSVMVSNIVRRSVATTDSRLRIGMKGNDVLHFLADQLNAKLMLPEPVPQEGEEYFVTVEIPSLNVFFPATREITI